jgi:hypothetical protein
MGRSKAGAAAAAAGSGGGGALEAHEAVVDFEVAVDEAGAVGAVEEAEELDGEEHGEELVEARALLRDARWARAVDDVEQGALRAGVKVEEALVAEGVVRLWVDDGRAEAQRQVRMGLAQHAEFPDVAGFDGFDRDSMRLFFFLVVLVRIVVLSLGVGTEGSAVNNGHVGTDVEVGVEGAEAEAKFTDTGSGTEVEEADAWGDVWGTG